MHESVYGAFMNKLLPLVQALKVGHGLESGVTIGPLISKAAVDKVARQVEDAKVCECGFGCGCGCAWGTP